jgi:hypothetical protein
VPSRRWIPLSQRCECGRRRLSDSALCSTCKRKRERSFAVPGRDVATLPVSVARNAAEREQDDVVEELSRRCIECRAPWGDHELTCSYIQFIDETEEYASQGGDEL